MPMLEEAADQWKSGAISEGYGLLAIAGNDPDTAVTAFEKARGFYKDPGDVLRTTLHEVIQLRALNRTPAALALCREQMEKHAGAPAIGLIRQFESELASNEKK
jgi:hypothetical protein